MDDDDLYWAVTYSREIAARGQVVRIKELHLAEAHTTAAVEEVRHVLELHARSGQLGTQLRAPRDRTFRYAFLGAG